MNVLFIRERQSCIMIENIVLPYHSLCLSRAPCPSELMRSWICSGHGVGLRFGDQNMFYNSSFHSLCLGQVPRPSEQVNIYARDAGRDPDSKISFRLHYLFFVFESGSTPREQAYKCSERGAGLRFREKNNSMFELWVQTRGMAGLDRDLCQHSFVSFLFLDPAPWSLQVIGEGRGPNLGNERGDKPLKYMCPFGAPTWQEWGRPGWIYIWVAEKEKVDFFFTRSSHFYFWTLPHGASM